MSVTFKELIEKYDTNININNVSKKLKNTDIMVDLDYTLDNIKKPKHEKDENGVETYTYQLSSNDKIIISFEPSNYRTMEIAIEKESEEGYLPYSWGWSYDGTPWYS